ncbi:MAG: amidohydrolase family protein [Anaerolineae bacterium]
MIIDIHTHVADLRTVAALERTPVTIENLIARLDEEGIDQAVVLPLWPTPEGIHPPYLFSEHPDPIHQMRAALAYPKRLIVFGNLDPRVGGNSARAEFGWALERFVTMGCRGLGEVTANVPADDPRVINLFRQCGQWKLPVTIHVIGPLEGFYGLVDRPGSPALARLLEAAPDTLVLGHGQGFWSEIAAGLTEEGKCGYPQGPINEEGSLAHLFRTYPNLYGDISAGSGHNALTRDPAYGLAFIDEFQDRLLFGTDVCFGDPQGRMPHLATLKRLLAEGDISQAVYDKITCGNALRVLGQAR